jgi:phosphopantothenoylcysteine decarboxylase/phosphopantothenate--cysteine ligase
MATGDKKSPGSGKKESPLKGKKVLITAGPTREHLDPVRFISNPSSGKMGYALARACLSRGARVTLISGPVALTPPPGLRTVRVESALQMFKAARAAFSGCDVFIASAAVSDYRPARASKSKIKKDSPGGRFLRLTLNPDILQKLSRAKGGRLLVGFAAETGSVLENARGKLRNKKLDLMVANRVGRKGTGFGSDFNQVTLLWPSGKAETLKRMAKERVAGRVADEIEKLLK